MRTARPQVIPVAMCNKIPKQQIIGGGVEIRPRVEWRYDLSQLVIDLHLWARRGTIVSCDGTNVKMKERKIRHQG